jgi:hypothetical protein
MHVSTFRRHIAKDGDPQQGTLEPELKFVPSLLSEPQINCLAGNIDGCARVPSSLPKPIVGVFAVFSFV